ncbi:hypothetical protein [Serratia marcescens]|uniref:hypothetical protein n=1 Tax=Serratia marcescens TaxID=615 RepID=UPI001F14D2C3|nr:hypothetical protein [Serratia marcescens]MDP8728363.1 hypothetical protein [Serratia marcescens]
MMRRGLSLKEMEDLSVIEFYELYIFDTFIEPQGPLVDDVRNAQTLSTMWLSSPNMTKEASRKFKIKDFMAVKPGEDVFKSEEMLKALKEEETRNRHKRMLDSISDPQVKAKLEETLRKQNGKE